MRRIIGLFELVALLCPILYEDTVALAAAAAELVIGLVRDKGAPLTTVPLPPPPPPPPA